jgi:hypothetical protein
VNAGNAAQGGSNTRVCHVLDSPFSPNARRICWRPERMT